MLTLIIQSCDLANNRLISSSSNSISKGVKALPDGLNIASACLCKNGNLIDGSESCAKASCIDSNLLKNKDKNITYLSITLGKDISTPIWKANGKTFSSTTPLKSVCTLSNYKCLVSIDGIEYLVKNGVIEETPTVTNQKVSVTSTNLILNFPESSTMEIVSLKKPSNLLKFEILFKDESAKDFTTIHTSNEVELSIYQGDGKLSPSSLEKFYAYSCIQVHDAGVGIYTLETFNFSAPIKTTEANVLGPIYEYKNPIISNGYPIRQAWPFICHVNSSLLPVFWQKETPSAPTIIGNLIEKTGVTQYTRLNKFHTKINFWYGDQNDFKETPEAKLEYLNYDIERRAFNHFKKNKNNGDWINQIIFSEMRYNLVPNPSLQPFSPNQVGLKIEQESQRFIMEPQPVDDVLADRYNYRCPTQEQLETAEEGRLASIKYILSSDTKRLQFETKPFFVACANGVSYPDTQGVYKQTERKIFFITMDDIKAILSKRGSKSSDIVERNLLGSSNSNSPFVFTLEELYQSRNQTFLPNEASSNNPNMSFTIVSPTIMSPGTTTCNNNNLKPHIGYVYGCYPVEIP